MSLMRCRGCTTKFAVGLLRCPQCHEVSELYAVPEHVAAAEEENMPKITVGDGASNALADEDSVADETQAADAVEDGAAEDEFAAKEPADQQEGSADETEAAPEPAAKEAATAPKTRKKASSAKS